MIETLFHCGPGYSPHLIRDGWQVAQLNYLPELHWAAIHRVERHRQTDEVFVLCKGGAVLTAAVDCEAGLLFQVVRMKTGVTYNIPSGVWHNIAMTPDDLVIIVEKNNTHLADVEYREFTPDERASWHCALAQEERRPEGMTSFERSGNA
jgi:hypothetical protein